MPSRGPELNHVLLYTRRFGRALRFYRDLLGLVTVEAEPPYYARLRSPNGLQTLGLHRLPPGQRMSARTEGVRLYFEVATLDAFCRKLAAHGVRFLQTPRTMPWGWRHAYLKDPDGHEISLYRAGRRRLKPAG